MNRPRAVRQTGANISRSSAAEASRVEHDADAEFAQQQLWLWNLPKWADCASPKYATVAEAQRAAVPLDFRYEPTDSGDKTAPEASRPAEAQDSKPVYEEPFIGPPGDSLSICTE